MRVKLKDVCEKGTSNLKQSDILSMDGKYPVYGASGYLGKIDYYHQDKPYIAVVKDGAGIGRTTIHSSKSSVIGTMQYLIPKENVMPEYLYYVVKHMHLQKYYTGATIPHIYFKDYQNEEFNLANSNMQREIVEVLKNVENTIRYQQMEINKFDQLIKARFIEMFGEINNIKNSYTKMNMPEVCHIIDGDRGKNYPTAKEIFREGFCLFLNAKNVTSNGFNFNDCQYISREKDKALRNGKLSIGDIVLTTRGTLGNLAFYNETIPYENIRINSGMVILRINRDILNEIYFIEQFKMQLNIIKNKIANGSAQPQLPISLMNRIKITVPPLEIQNQFADFVRQVDKSRFRIEKSMIELEREVVYD